MTARYRYRRAERERERYRGNPAQRYSGNMTASEYRIPAASGAVLPVTLPARPVPGSPLRSA